MSVPAPACLRARAFNFLQAHDTAPTHCELQLVEVGLDRNSNRFQPFLKMPAFRVSN
jgi:hypothetical protein